MAAILAHHPSGFWQPPRPAEENMQMNMSGCLPPTGRPLQHRPYQPSPMSLHMPHFGQPVHHHFMPFNGSYGFENLSVNPYVAPPHVPVTYPQPTVPQPPQYVPSVNSLHEMPVVREARNGVSCLPLQSPPVKQESTTQAPAPRSPQEGPVTTRDRKDSCTSESACSPVVFNTHVDNLMKMIQATSDDNPEAKPKDDDILALDDSSPDSKSGQKSKKRYQCSFDGCYSRFQQKTHLDIHVRAHTGQKPFACREPGCGQAFSQLGNLRTHERRHSGEKPYACDQCGKRFAQRGNVRSHKITHTNQKPFVCRLDNCDKPFTQLGNLKTHQNKFHVETIRYLTSKFANPKETDYIDVKEKELWDYFANLYKNSNKGIKGRGKDRRISTSVASSPRRPSLPGNGAIPPILTAAGQHTYAHSAPVSPTRALFDARGIAKRGPSSVQMTRQSSRGSVSSFESAGAASGPGPVLPPHPVSSMQMTGYTGVGAAQVRTDVPFVSRPLF